MHTKPATGSKDLGGRVFDRDQDIDPYFREYMSARSLLADEPVAAAIEMQALANRGSIMSVLYTADALRMGWGYDQDLPKAERWYRVAADAGSHRALHGLGLTYYAMGRHEESRKEWELAVSRGFPPSMNALGSVYFNGIGVAVDKQRALELWRRGAAAGHLYSKRSLAFEFLKGQFGPSKILEGVGLYLSMAAQAFKVMSGDPHSDERR
jgi:TPR repeat protein